MTMWKELIELFIAQPIGMFGASFAEIGFLLIVSSSISFRFRSPTTKKAWEVRTFTLLKFGIILMVVGSIMFAIQTFIIN